MVAGDWDRQAGRTEEGQPPWHALGLGEVLTAVRANEGGLTETEAAARLAAGGPNQLPQQPPTTIWQLLRRQFRSPLIYLLAVAALVSLLIQHPTDAAFIAVILVVNAAIGGYQEWKAEQSTRALQKLLQVRAAVLRDGEVREILAETVVPGDVVWLESGNRVPADVRLVTAHGLEVDESLLTGESLAVLKDPGWSGEAATPVADRLNMAHAGSFVVRGRGKGVVVATGRRTVVGQLAVDVMAAPAGKPPLLERMERFSRAVAVAIVAGVAVVALLGMALHGYTLGEMFTFAVALAVSAVPEGLPAALTVALAVATHRMARRGVIVRRLAAVEGLGKLHPDRQRQDRHAHVQRADRETGPSHRRHDIRRGGGRVRPAWTGAARGEAVEAAGHAGLDRLARAAILCNEADLHQRDRTWAWRGDPTDVALLALAHKLGWNRETTLDRHPQVNEIPFEPEHRYAATYHRVRSGGACVREGRRRSACWQCVTGQRVGRAWPADRCSRWQNRATACWPSPKVSRRSDLDPSRTPAEPKGLTFLGFVGMIDPLRPGVREAVAACHEAGIDVCMITGDHPVTALAIARDLGLASRPDQVASGRELEGKSLDELQKAIDKVRVFARVDAAAEAGTRGSRPTGGSFRGGHRRRGQRRAGAAGGPHRRGDGQGRHRRGPRGGRAGHQRRQLRHHRRRRRGRPDRLRQRPQGRSTC